MLGSFAALFRDDNFLNISQVEIVLTTGKNLLLDIIIVESADQLVKDHFGTVIHDGVAALLGAFDGILAGSGDLLEAGDVLLDGLVWALHESL